MAEGRDALSRGPAERLSARSQLTFRLQGPTADWTVPGCSWAPALASLGQKQRVRTDRQGRVGWETKRAGTDWTREGQRRGDGHEQSRVSPGPWGPAGAGALQPPPLLPAHTLRGGGGLHPCLKGCRPDSVALWFTRDEIRSHPVTTVEADAASQGHGVPAPSACPVFSQTPVPIHRSRRIPASRRIPVLLSSSGQQTRPVKGQVVHGLGLGCWMVSVTAPQLGRCSMKAAVDDVRGGGCGRVLIKLYLHEQAVGHICPVGSGLSPFDCGTLRPTNCGGGRGVGAGHGGPVTSPLGSGEALPCPQQDVGLPDL